MNDEIRIITKSSYPQTLNNIAKPPDKLYIRGDLQDAKDQRYLCVVGSRSNSPYGRDAVYKIMSGLRGYTISIVSGLAYGIDSLAHRAALEAGLHCVAFPGSTLEWNALYPQAHVPLAREILASGGALISRWETGYPTKRWAFPARNALMAGISHATLIIEAGKRSGSLMTAKHSEDYHRDVMAVPGSIFSALSYGPHMLLKGGAIIVTKPEDVLEALGFKVSKVLSPTSPVIDSLDPLSKKIMGSIFAGEKTTDEIIERLKISAGELAERLTQFELDGLIMMSDGVIRVL